MENQAVRCERRVATAALCMSLVAVAIVSVGCSKAGDVSAVPAAADEMPQVTKVRKAFENAESGVRFSVDDALRIVKSGVYADAVPALNRLAENAKLSMEQKQALTELIEKLKTMPAGLANH